MSSGQKPRTREHFPRMKDRAGRRRRRRALRRWESVVDAFKAVSRAVVQAAEVVVAAFAPLAQVIERVLPDLRQRQVEPQLPQVGAITAADLERLHDWSGE